MAGGYSCVNDEAIFSCAGGMGAVGMEAMLCFSAFICALISDMGSWAELAELAGLARLVELAKSCELDSALPACALESKKSLESKSLAFGAPKFATEPESKKVLESTKSACGAICWVCGACVFGAGFALALGSGLRSEVFFCGKSFA